MERELHKKLPAILDSLSEFIQAVSKFFKEHGFSEEKISQVELVTEEALVNIFSYAYPNMKGEVEIHCQRINDFIIMKIIDSGIPFDILSLPEPDVRADIEERSVGGLGVFFIRKMTTNVSYQRKDKENILTIKMKKP